MSADFPLEVESPQDIPELSGARRLALFLDYDGTLAPFAPTPDDILPDPELIELLRGLSNLSGLQIAVISGRRLAHIEALLPVPGLILAGSYGLEMIGREGKREHALPFEQVRPIMEALKPRWQELLAGQEGFYLEDKGWSLAIHARYAEDRQAGAVLEQALPAARQAAAAGDFRILGGSKFLEICPAMADKGLTVGRLMDRYNFPGSLPVYIGDDDKDEEAYAVIQSRGGVALQVSAARRDTRATYRLASPTAVRRWLTTLGELFSTA
jgi:trehalose-phosphatase